MKYLGVEFETKLFDLEKYRKDMEDFNRRYPPVKGKMYNADGNLETVPGYCDCGEKLTKAERRVKLCTKCQRLAYRTDPKVKVIEKEFVVQESLF